jgi:hypothetical protein
MCAKISYHSVGGNRAQSRGGKNQSKVNSGIAPWKKISFRFSTAQFSIASRPDAKSKRPDAAEINRIDASITA